MKKLLIVGAGGFAREVLWLVRELKDRAPYRVIGFAHEGEHLDFPDTSGGPPLLGNDDWVFSHLRPGEVEFVVAVGNPELRQKIAKKYLDLDYKPATLVHPGVQMSEFARVGRGSILCAGSILTTQVEMGEFSVLNLGATVGHDVDAGSYLTAHPGVHINGNVTLGTGVEIGSGAVLLPGIQVGNGATIGAGAVVTENVAEGLTVKGVPAR